MDLANLLGKLAEHGTVGLLAVIAFAVAWSKDRELTAERAARIADARLYTDMALELQARVLTSVEKLSDLTEVVARPKRNG